MVSNIVCFADVYQNAVYTWQGSLPNRLCLQFEVLDDAGNWNINVTRNPPIAGQNCMLNLQNAFEQIFCFGQYFNSQSVPIANRQSAGRRAMAVLWLVDRERRESILLRDGQLVLHGQNSQNLPGVKTGSSGNLPEAGDISFRMVNSRNGRLRNIVLSEWKGGVEAVTNAPPANADTLQLHDMTRCTGTLASLRAGQFLLTGAATVPSCPADRVAWVTFRKFDQQVARRNETDVRVMLSDGDQLTLNHVRWDEAGLTGTSEATGLVTIPLAALQRVDFQPYSLSVPTTSPENQPAFLPRRIPGRVIRNLGS